MARCGSARPHPVTPLDCQTHQTNHAPSEANLKMVAPAHQAARCAHLRASGVRCGSPALRGSHYCYYHEHFHGGPRLIYPSLAKLDDAHGIQTALAEVLTGILDGRLPHKTGALLLYGLQTAVANLKHMPDLDPQDIVTDLPDHSDAEHESEDIANDLGTTPEHIAAERACASDGAADAIHHLAQHHRFAGSTPSGDPARDGSHAELISQYSDHNPDATRKRPEGDCLPAEGSDHPSRLGPQKVNRNANCIVRL